MKFSIKRSHAAPLLLIMAMGMTMACQKQTEHTAEAINPKDSVSMMTTYGVNTLISDSGIIKYRIITETWEVNTNKNPSLWIFHNGLFLKQFDQNFHTQAFIQADTAYYYDQKRLWELRGRVRIKTRQDVKFFSEKLYWDENKHEMYSDVYSKLITPTRQLEGNYFRSDDKMTQYIVTNTKGQFEKEDFVSGESTVSPSSTSDSTSTPIRQAQTPIPKQ